MFTRARVWYLCTQAVVYSGVLQVLFSPKVEPEYSLESFESSPYQFFSRCLKHPYPSTASKVPKFTRMSVF